MFKYTRAAVSSLLKDFKTWSLIFTWVFFAITVGYNIFAIVMGYGFLWANIISLCLVTFYTFFDVFTKTKNIRTERKVIKTIYNWSRIILKAITLGITVYGLYIATNDQINPLSIILSTLMIIFWILSVLIEVVRNIISNKVSMFEAAVKQDMDDMKKPFETVGNTVKKMFGKEVDETPKPKSKIIKKLDKVINFKKEQKNKRNIEK